MSGESFLVSLSHIFRTIYRGLEKFMGLSPGRVHQRTYVIETTQNTSPYIGCLNNK